MTKIDWKPEPECTICKSHTELYIVRDIIYCIKCIKELNILNEEL